MSGKRRFQRAVSNEEILIFFREYSAKHGYPPTMREVCVGMGILSISTVSKRLTELVELGLMKHDAWMARSYVVIDQDAKNG